MPFKIAAMLLFPGLLLSMTTQASLLARDLNNDQIIDAYYDSVLDITWLKDANLAASNSFGVSGITQYVGVMSWGTATQWIAAMNAYEYLGHNEWRLAKIDPIGGGGGYSMCCSGFDGRFDFGYNITSQKSELAYMFYVNLANLGLFDVNGNVQSGHGSIDDTLNPFDDNLFDDIRWGWYWSGSQNFANGSIMVFDMANGAQTNQLAGGPNFVWAVHQGDIGFSIPVPEPNVYTLILLGLGLLIWVVRRNNISAIRT